jgi:hypothetical protein
MNRGHITSRGTWQTILYASDLGRPCVWIEPNGKLNERMP